MKFRVAVAAASLMRAGMALAEGAPAPAPAPAQGALVAPGRSPELEILFTGDVVGFLEPCG